MRVRENAESIAFYGGEGLERAAASERLDKLVDTRIRNRVLRRRLFLAVTAIVALLAINIGMIYGVTESTKEMRVDKKSGIVTTASGREWPSNE